MSGHAQDAPLLQGDAEENHEQHASEHEHGDLLESQLTQPGIFIWALTFSAGISGLLFGYDTGVISATLVGIGSDLSQRPLSTLDKSLITSCTSLFALIASPITGLLADRLGRKRVILIADALFVIGALWQAWTESVAGMIFGRSIVGLAVGGASLVVPLYISELSPSPFRGRLVTLSIVFITLGQVVAYVVGYLLSNHIHGWRLLVGYGAIPAICQCILLAFLPETPRWLVKVGRSEDASRVLHRVYGPSAKVQHIIREVLQGIETQISEEAEASRNRTMGSQPAKIHLPFFSRLDYTWGELFRVGGNRRALTIACLLQGLQVLCGFNSLMYFSATIFALIGFESPTQTSLVIAVTNFLFTLVAFVLIDRAGRRRILLYSIPIMVCGLIFCAISFIFIDLTPDKAKSVDDDSAIVTRSWFWPRMLVAAMMLYVSGYAVGIGNVPWQQSELFPLSVRSQGSGLATATNWGSNFVVGLSFLPMMDLLSPTVTFAVYAVICVAGWITTWRIYPETKGLSLEEVGALLENDWGVQQSLRRGQRGP